MIELSPEDRNWLASLIGELRDAPHTIDPKCEGECREVVTLTSLLLGQICERLEKIACVKVTPVDWKKYILGIPPWDEATLRQQGEAAAFEAGQKFAEKLEADLIAAIAPPATLFGMPIIVDPSMPEDSFALGYFSKDSARRLFEQEAN